MALSSWIKEVFGVTPKDEALYARALTHGSPGSDTYERLEFLGDRVLGLVVADWIYARFPKDDEGKLSHRFNNLVSGEACAEIGRTIGVSSRLRLGKQARDDGAHLGARGAVRIAGLSGWTRRNFGRWLFEDYPRALLLTPRRWHRGMLTGPGAYRGTHAHSTD
jgi:dsRNA-specific ribonuclease